MPSLVRSLEHGLTRDQAKRAVVRQLERVPRDYSILVLDFIADWNDFNCRVSFEARDESVSGTIQILPQCVVISAYVPTILDSLWSSIIGTISDSLDEAHS